VGQIVAQRLGQRKDRHHERHLRARASFDGAGRGGEDGAAASRLGGTSVNEQALLAALVLFVKERICTAYIVRGLIPSKSNALCCTQATEIYTRVDPTDMLDAIESIHATAATQGPFPSTGSVDRLAEGQIFMGSTIRG